jgi:hypothetical protein
MSDGLKFIEKLGFKKVGKWERDKDEDEEIFFVDERDEKEQKQKELVYAFVANGVVMYIGQTEKTLQERMGNYEKTYKSQGRNFRGNEQIKDALNENHKEVLVYAISLDEIRTKKINMVGEEIGLTTTDAFEKIAIGTINPEWNIDGKENKDLPKDIKVPSFKFKQVNEWKLDGEKILLDKPECEKEGWFYFFVSNDKEIIHVGTTKKKLKERMDSFRNKVGSVDKHKNKKIKDKLEKNVKVFVYAYQFNVAAIDDKIKNIIKYGIERALEDELSVEEKKEQYEDD